MEDFYGIKELYDVDLRLTKPIDICGRHYDVNESILKFNTAELANLNEIKNTVQARGGYHNNPLIDWETDKEINFAITNGVLSPISWSLLSNSKADNYDVKSICYCERLKTIEDDEYCYVDLKFLPNYCGCLIGVQGNPDNEPLPMGRRPELPLKPLPPKKDKFFFIYNEDNGKRIEDFKIINNRVYFATSYRNIYVDYTTDYKGSIKTINIGERLFNNYLHLTGKMTSKNERTGEVSTVLIEIPKIKISSSLSIRLGKNYEESVISDFFFTGYPDENTRREKQLVCKISFLDKELTGDYL